MPGTKEAARFSPGAVESTETDFFKNSDMPIIATRPRSQREPIYLENAMEAQQNLLHGLLAIGMGLVKPGSVRWEEDRFTAEYAEAPHGTFGVKITTADGQDAPESVKAKVLADLEAGAESRKVKPAFMRCERRILTAAEAEAERVANTPVPGSVEARIMALFEAREQERLRKGIQGRLVRDREGRVTEIHFDPDEQRRLNRMIREKYFGSKQAK